nr:uncharacterized protein LOC111509367 [Leptinotarsa decemlineata]
MRLVYSLSALQLFVSIDGSIVSQSGSIGDTFRQCLISQAPGNLGHCLGVGAITQLQSLDSSPEFDLVDGLTLTRDAQEYRDVHNFAEGDPSSLRSLVDSFSYVFSKRNTRWDMGFLYPGLAIRISPSVHQGGTLEFTLDSHRESLNVHSLKEAGTGRLLARQFLLPFLLGFKFNVASLIPILFGILALIAKKALIISKIALIVTSALALGSLLLGNDKYQQHHYAPNQFGHPGYEGIHGYNSATKHFLEVINDDNCEGPPKKIAVLDVPGQSSTPPSSCIVSPTTGTQTQAFLSCGTPRKTKLREKLRAMTRKNCMKTSSHERDPTLEDFNEMYDKFLSFRNCQNTSQLEEVKSVSKKFVKNCSTMRLRLLSLVLLLSIEKYARSENITDFLSGISVYKKCFYEKHPGTCLRKKALEALNETIMDDRPITIGFLEIQKNPDYFVNRTELENFPEVTERSAKLGDVLMEKIDEFFKSRTIKLNLSNAFEARKGGGGGGGGGKKGGNMALMAAAGMCAMMANMVMGKMALMAGSALMIAKVSLLLSLVMLLKKMQEKGGGGEEKHIVYADSGHSHGGGGGYGGGGGWHRSLDDPHNIIYKGQWTASSDNGSGL